MHYGTPWPCVIRQQDATKSTIYAVTPRPIKCKRTQQRGVVCRGRLSSRKRRHQTPTRTSLDQSCARGHNHGLSRVVVDRDAVKPTMYADMPPLIQFRRTNRLQSSTRGREITPTNQIRRGSATNQSLGQGSVGVLGMLLSSGN